MLASNTTGLRTVTTAARSQLPAALWSCTSGSPPGREWREVIREVPRYRQGWRGLGEILVCSGRIAEAEALAEDLLSNGALRVEGLLMKSRTAQLRGCLAEARVALDRAMTERRDDLETLRCRSQFFFEHGTPDEAEQAFNSLIERDPQDASAHHNLGTLLARIGRYDGAIQEFRQALRYRPNYAPTYVNLGNALNESGRFNEAATAWEHALRLTPDDRGLR